MGFTSWSIRKKTSKLKKWHHFFLKKVETIFSNKQQYFLFSCSSCLFPVTTWNNFGLVCLREVRKVSGFSLILPETLRRRRKKDGRVFSWHPVSSDDNRKRRRKRKRTGLGVTREPKFSVFRTALVEALLLEKKVKHGVL